MKELDSLLESVIQESNPNSFSDAADYNFMAAANRTMREAELAYGKRCIEPLIERISDKKIDGPALRIFFSSLTRIYPTRQTAYEQKIIKLLPNWTSALDGNPQIPLPVEFLEATLDVIEDDIKCPQGMIMALVTALESEYHDVVLSALKFIERAGFRESTELLANRMQTVSAEIRANYILTSARLSVLDESLNITIKK